jgi:hypothetical protein
LTLGGTKPPGQLPSVVDGEGEPVLAASLGQ